MVDVGKMLRHPRQRIADVQCSRLKFEPGDRLLVRVYTKLDVEQKKRLKKSIQKWAGTDVEILIFDAFTMEIEVEKSQRIRGDFGR